MLNIAVLVSGGGTNLQHLIDFERAGELANGKIKLVLASNPNAFALERARSHHIATEVLPNMRTWRPTIMRLSLYCRTIRLTLSCWPAL